MGRTQEKQGNTELIALYYDIEEGKGPLWEDKNCWPKVKIGEVIESHEPNPGELYVVMRIIEKEMIKGLLEMDVYLQSIGTTNIDPEYKVTLVQFGTKNVRSFPVVVKEAEAGSKEKAIEDHESMGLGRGCHVTYSVGLVEVNEEYC